MTFRTVVRDGLIVINTHGEIPDGTPVEVVLSSNGDSGGKRAGKRSSRGKSGSAGHVPEFGFGMWKHRKDIVDTAEFARELRIRTSRRIRRG